MKTRSPTLDFHTEARARSGRKFGHRVGASGIDFVHRTDSDFHPPGTVGVNSFEPLDMTSRVDFDHDQTKIIAKEHVTIQLQVAEKVVHEVNATGGINGK